VYSDILSTSTANPYGVLFILFKNALSHEKYGKPLLGSFFLYFTMSGLVVWELLGMMLIALLEERGAYEEARELARQKSRHPLVERTEATLNKLLSPAGGLSCPELEEKIREAKKRDPRGLRAVLAGVVDSYLIAKRKGRKVALQV